jgi:hypothetical protein
MAVLISVHLLQRPQTQFRRGEEEERGGEGRKLIGEF